MNKQAHQSITIVKLVYGTNFTLTPNTTNRYTISVHIMKLSSYTRCINIIHNEHGYNVLLVYKIL